MSFPHAGAGERISIRVRSFRWEAHPRRAVALGRMRDTRLVATEDLPESVQPMSPSGLRRTLRTTMRQSKRAWAAMRFAGALFNSGIRDRCAPEKRRRFGRRELGCGTAYFGAWLAAGERA